MKNIKKQPMVSVIMPVYNAGEFLVEAIESIVSQTYKNYELLIVDDGSRDNSWEIIQKYQKKYKNLIRAFRLKKNTNAAGNGAVNTVLPNARGQYIARMDADDIAHPQRLKRQVEFLDRNLDVILVGTQAKVINRFGKVTGKKTYPLDHEGIYKQYAVVHPIIHPSCMIRRSLLPKWNKLYEMRFGVNDDYYTFFTLFRYGKFANINEFLLSYRIHEHNTSLQNIKDKFFNTVNIRLTAIRKLDYRISLGGFIKLVAQIVFVSLIPERVLLKAYLMVKEVRK